MLRVTVVGLARQMASSIAITHDVLAAANRISVDSGRRPPFTITAVNAGSRSAGHGLSEADLLILPGLGVTSEEELDARLRGRTAQRLCGALAEAHAGGAMLAAPCASAFLLAQAGLLDGRRATTTWWLAPAFRKRFPRVDLTADEVVVADWLVATAGAAMAQMDLMLAIVGRFASSGLARRCASVLLLSDRQSQVPFMAVGYLARRDPSLAKAERWVRDRIGRDFTVEELARAVGLEPRTFSRRTARACGLTPIRFVQRLRIEEARRLLETTHLPVDEVARCVGYAEPSTLRRLIRRDTGRSPSDFRL